MARELIEAGCDVMVEKPITATVDEAKRLIEIARKNNRIVQVGHVERYNPAIIAVADLVRETRGTSSASASASSADARSMSTSCSI